MKRSYYSKHNDSASQQETKVLSINFIKNLVYWDYLCNQISYVY